MDDTLSLLERTFTAQIDRMLVMQRNRIQKLEAQVEMLMKERERMRSMLDFFEQLGAEPDSSPP